jgi:hypothetical protein
MAKGKADRPYVGSLVGQFPLPSHHKLQGKFWNRVERYSREQEDLMQRSHKLTARRNELQQELEFQRSRHDAAVVEAARFDRDEPDDAEVKRVEKEIAKVDDKIRAIRRAAEIAQREYLEFMSDTPDEVLADLRQRAESAFEEYQTLVARAEQRLTETGVMYGTYLKLHPNAPEYGPGIGEPPTDYASRPWHHPEYADRRYQPFNWLEPEEPTEAPAGMISTFHVG